MVSKLLGQTIQLNEIVSTNTISLIDEDGDSPDWIEIYNPSESSVQLKGYGLYDDLDEPFDWVFPKYELNPHSFLVLFASGKDRTSLVQIWDAIITEEDQWYYWVGSSEPPSDWMKSENVPIGWSSGSSGFGYGDNDDKTIIDKTMSVFIRKSFQVDKPEAISKLLFHVDYDDGYIAYLNGVEFSRKNMGMPNSPVQYNNAATGLHEAEIKSGGFPEPIWIDIDKYPLLKGENILGIQVHNYNQDSSDLSCIPFLTAGYNTEEENYRVPDIRIELPISYFHTNFKIKSEGEIIILSDTLGEIIDSISTGKIPTDKSKGRIKESSDWAFFENPTPGLSNNQVDYRGFLSPPTFSGESGFYFGTNTINLTHDENGVKIFYTFDGSVPDQNSKLFDQPIIVTKNTVVRTIAYKEGWVKSDAATQTYIFDKSYDLPVVFLSAEPSDFFDPDTGIYVKGPNASSSFPHFGANFWEDWERPIHFEIIEPNGQNYSANAGTKIYGAWSRGHPQKSLSFFSRKKYGSSSFNYKLFPDLNIDKYESFILRNSGNDWDSSMLRDGYTSTLLNGIDIDYQKFRPTIVYLNGEYWGIHNLREKISEHFIASHHILNIDDIDIIALNGESEDNIELIHGSKTDYYNLFEYILSNNMSDSKVYKDIKSWIDIDEHINYIVLQIFIDNRDWPGNNVKLWKDNRENGKWRWILYDTDWGFAFPGWMSKHYEFNTLEFALESNGPEWPNPPWSTYFFRKLLENEFYKNKFINTYCDYLNTVFKPENLNAKLDSVKNNIVKHIPKHRERWNRLQGWNNEISKIKEFNNKRSIHARNHLRTQFNLSTPKNIIVGVLPKNAGKIKINSIVINEESWFGLYFPNVPIEVKAIPKEGYTFVGWSEMPDSGSTVVVNIDKQNKLTAQFQLADIEQNSIVINEINYNSNDSFDTGDWVELFNHSNTTINLKNWVFKDDNDSHSFVFKAETVIQPKSYLILAEKPENMHNNFSNLDQLYGPFEFGLSGGGDEVRLFNSNGVLMDSVQYDDDSPWPIEADGQGSTLELKDPILNNENAFSWTASEGHGTPESINSNYNTLGTNQEKIIPQKTTLLPSYPNPFNGNLTIPFELNDNQVVSLKITNILGQEIKKFNFYSLQAGKHKVTWNGVGINGNPVGSGMYFISLETNSEVSFQKVLYLK